MNDDELKKVYEKEKEYKDIFESFINSEDEKTFSKKEVKKIIEAHIFREFINYKKQTKKTKARKNLLVTTKNVGLRLFNIRTLLSIFLTYIFYIGFLILIDEFIFINIFYNKWIIFIIAFGLTLLDKIIKPLLFIADLISFTFHKISLVTLLTFTAFIYFISYFLGEKVSFEKAVVIAIIVLLGTAIIEFLKRDSLIKTKYIDDIDLQDGEDNEQY